MIESYRHGVFVLDHIGTPLLWAMAIVAALQIPAFARVFRESNLNWRLLWSGVAPLLYLVFSGSGLNPFVSLISVPTLLLFGLVPFNACVRSRTLLVILVFGAAVVSNAYSGIAGHTSTVSTWVPLRSGLDALVNRLRPELVSAKSIAVGFTYIGSLDSGVLLNSLAFDYGFQTDGSGCATEASRKLCSVSAVMAPAAQVDWIRIPGAGEDEKIDCLVAELKSKADVIIMVENVSLLPMSTALNVRTERLQSGLLASGNLVPMGSAIPVSKTESVLVYTNTGKVANTKCIIP